MIPSIAFTTLAASNDVKAIFGTPITRVYPWHRAPQKPTIPYVTYGLINSQPENYLACPSDTTDHNMQMNIWDTDPSRIENGFAVIRQALEGAGLYLMTYSTPEKDPDTNLYSVRMDWQFWDERLPYGT